MTSPQERVLDLVKASTISAQDGKALLAAIDKRPSRWHRFVRPFEHLQPVPAALIMVATTALGVFLSARGIRFDGALDMHAAIGATSYAIGMIDVVTAIGVLSAAFWGLARIAGSRGRFVDFILGVGVARTWLVVAAVPFAVLQPDPSGLGSQIVSGSVPVAFVVAVVIGLPALVWFFIWLYQAHKTASGLRGARLIMTFIGGLVAAEVVSKFVIWLV